MSTTDLNAKSTSELLALYNEAAAAKGEAVVKRFSDRNAALKRTASIMGIGAGTAAPEAETSPEASETEASGTTGNEETTNETVTETNDAPGAETSEQESDVAKTAKKAKKTVAKKTAKKATARKPGAKKTGAKKGNTRGPGENGERVGKGTNREKLLNLFEKNMGKQVPISAMMKAVYGESRKDLKGPVMMVMKGLLIVFKTQKLKLEIRKDRENKENRFGLYKKA